MARNWQECRCGSVIWDMARHNLPGMCGANITEALTQSPAPTLERPLPAVSLVDIEVTLPPAADTSTIPTLPIPKGLI